MAMAAPAFAAAFPAAAAAAALPRAAAPARRRRQQWPGAAALLAGLDRGVAAEPEQASKVGEAARRLEAAGEPVALPGDLGKLQGRWRLVYTSGFESGSLGGLRPGPSFVRLPFTLGQVYQRIDVAARELDNVVEIKYGAPWPLPPVEAEATLAHKFQVVGGAGIKIIFERTSINPKGLLRDLPALDIPQLPDFLQPPSQIRSGQFETTFLDDDFRISRGDRGELRIFVRA
eukprot:SM000203S06127  [mRNA]  locus=s203:56327:57859:- [translate_table: standard]